MCLSILLAFTVTNLGLVYFFIYMVRIRKWCFGPGLLFSGLQGLFKLMTRSRKDGTKDDTSVVWREAIQVLYIERKLRNERYYALQAWLPRGQRAWVNCRRIFCLHTFMVAEILLVKSVHRIQCYSQFFRVVTVRFNQFVIRQNCNRAGAVYKRYWIWVKEEREGELAAEDISPPLPAG